MKLRRHLQRIGALLFTTAVASIAMMGGMFAPAAFAAGDDIASGTTPACNNDSRTCDWVIDKNGTLIIQATSGDTGVIAANKESWSNFTPYIKRIEFKGTVIASKDSWGSSSFSLFSNCERVEQIDLNGLDTSQLTDLGNMFKGCSKLSSINGLGTLQTQSAESFAGMFQGCSKLTSLDLSSLNVNNAKSVVWMFENCKNLESVKLPETTSSKLEAMRGMFLGCSSLKQVDFEKIDTNSVVDMSEMFEGCSSLKKITGLNSGELTGIYQMFSGCGSLTNFDDTCFSNLNTSKIRNFQGLFNGCSSLKSIDISDKVTLYATNLSELFRDCASLEEITGLSTVNTSNVIALNGLFSGCKSLTSIDLSNFDIDITEDNATQLFYCCINLTTIFDDGGFVISPPSSYFGFSHIFDGCNKLIGGNGTSVGGWYLQTDENGDKDLAHPSTSIKMARIDGGPDSATPGYFTKKGEQPHVHKLVNWSTKANCNQSGYKNGKQCSECGTIVDRGTYISERDHAWPESPSIENRVEATDDSNGSYNMIWRCTVCNEILRTRHVIVKSKTFLYPTHTLDGTIIPVSMLFKELDKKKLSDTWTKEETLFFISQSICLLNETNPGEDATNWDRSYVSEESAAKIAYLCFMMFDGKPAWELAYDNHYRCCSPKAYEERYEDDDNPKHYSDTHTDHYAECWHNNTAWAGTLLDKYYSSVNISQAAALSVLKGDVVWQLNAYDHLGNLLLKAFPNGATTAQLDEIGTDVLCNAISYPVPCKELKTNAALYKAIGDYIIANASGADQIAVANKIMLERNASSGGSSSGSGGSSSGGSISGGGSSGGASSSEVNALKSEIASLKAELEKLKKGTANDETIAALQKTISSLEKSLDAVSASLVQTQNALVLSEMPRKISKNIKRAVDSKIKIALPTSASGTKVTFKPASNKYLKVSKSGNVTTLKSLKRGKSYTIKVIAVCGKQTKEITLRLKAK